MPEVEFPQLGGGLLEGIAPDKLEQNQLSVLKNLVYKGHYPALETRPGLSSLGSVKDVGGSVVDADVTLISQFQLRDGTTYYLAAAGAVLGQYNAVTGDFEELDDSLTADYPISATTLDNIHILCNGQDAPLKVYESGGALAVAALGGSPPTAKYVTSHHGRVYMWGVTDDPSRIYISALYDPEDWSSTGVVGAHNFQISPDDAAGPSTGLSVSPRIPHVLLYKQRAMYELFGTDVSNWEEQLVSAAVGCTTHWSIARVKDTDIFLDQNGFIRAYPGGGREPEIISTPYVETTLSTLNTDYLDQVRAVATPDDKYILFFPTDSAALDTAVVYDGLRDTWCVWEGFTPTMLAVLSLFQANTVLVGDANGKVYTLDGDDDDGTDIDWELETHAHSIGPAELILRRISVRGEGDINVSYAMNEYGSFSAALQTELNNDWQSVLPPFGTVFPKGHSFRLRFTGSGSVRIDQPFVQYRERRRR